MENEPYPLKVLAKHWPDVPKFHDIRTFKGSDLNERPTVISGGFPCQPFSVAGPKKGKADNRYLWPEMCRIIREVRPTWVIGENVRGLVNLALDTVYEDLEGLGYTVQSFLISAVGIGAPHKRERIFIVGHTSSGRLSGDARRGTGEESSDGRVDGGAGIMADSSGARRYRSAREEQHIQRSSLQTARLGNGSSCLENSDLQRLQIPSRLSNDWTEWDSPTRASWWCTEPSMGRVAHGVPHRVDRLRALGNAVVPQQIYPIFAAIAAIENGGKSHDPNHP